MREYFTPEKIVEFLSSCEREGINTHQFSRPEQMADVFRILRQRGSKMKFICLHSDRPQNVSIKKVVELTEPIAIVHHGGVTDKLFREGKKDKVRDFVKRVKDSGVLAGVSAHNPDCIKQIAEEGWQVDFFMACFYYLTRTSAELEKMPPIVTVQVGYPFFACDPLTMTEVVRQVDQPCLGYKILAAGRMCDRDYKVKAAFKFAFEHIKRTDGVIVGMYPRYHNQVRQDAKYARQFGKSQCT
jgi:predicted aldo/keto reductase-like oxidoreductase